MKKIPDDIKQMDERIRKLKAKEQRTREEKTEFQFAHAAKVGFRIGAELISGVIVGAGIGYLLDILFGTRPRCQSWLPYRGRINLRGDCRRRHRLPARHPFRHPPPAADYFSVPGRCCRFLECLPLCQKHGKRAGVTHVEPYGTVCRQADYPD